MRNKIRAAFFVIWYASRLSRQLHFPYYRIYVMKSMDVGTSCVERLITFPRANAFFCNMHAFVLCIHTHANQYIFNLLLPRCSSIRDSIARVLFCVHGAASRVVIGSRSFSNGRTSENLTSVSKISVGDSCEARKCALWKCEVFYVLMCSWGLRVCDILSLHASSLINHER